MPAQHAQYRRARSHSLSAVKHETSPAGVRPRAASTTHRRVLGQWQPEQQFQEIAQNMERELAEQQGKGQLEGLLAAYGWALPQ